MPAENFERERERVKKRESVEALNVQTKERKKRKIEFDRISGRGRRNVGE